MNRERIIIEAYQCYMLWYLDAQLLSNFQYAVGHLVITCKNGIWPCFSVTGKQRRGTLASAWSIKAALQNQCWVGCYSMFLQSLDIPLVPFKHAIIMRRSL